MKKYLFAGFAVLMLVGCGPTDTKETPGMREVMTSKKGFDINNVPEKDRARVLAIVGGRGNPAASKPAGPPGQ